MFSFFFRKKDPWSSPRAMENWVKQLPSSDPMQAQASVLDMLDDYLRSENSSELSTLPSLWVLSERIEPILQELLDHYLQNHKSSMNVERVTWKAIFELSKKLDRAYESIFEHEPEILLKTLKREGTSKSIGYYIRNKNLQAKMRLFHFEQWIPAQWSLLHKSFILAEQAKVTDCPIKLHRFEANVEHPITTTIENEYIQILLLQLLNVGSFTPAHIQHAHTWLLMNASELKVEHSVQAEGFMVDISSTEGLQRISDKMPLILNGSKESIRFINTYPIIQILENEIKTTEDIANEIQRAHPLHENIQLHQKWYGLWNHNPYYWQRKGEREKDKDTSIWLVDNWQGMHQCLMPIEGGASETPIAVPVSHVGDEYTVFDHSQSGYGLVGTVNESRPFRLTMLLLLYNPEAELWSIGALRRLKKLNIDQAEMGIEILGHYVCTMQPVQLTKTRSRFDTNNLQGYEINLQDDLSQHSGDTIPTLYLKAQENTKAGNQPSLFILKKDYTQGKKLYLTLEMGLFEITLQSAIEEGHDWIWCGFTAEHQSAVQSY